jgi:hypothetical protein
MTVSIVNKDKELGIGSAEEGTRLKITDAKGPRIGGNSYYLCQTCNKVVYSIYRDGPIADDTRNRVFCTCDGKQDMGNQTMVVSVVDVEDVTTPKQAKEFRDWLSQQNQKQ